MTMSAYEILTEWATQVVYYWSEHQQNFLGPYAGATHIGKAYDLWPSLRDISYGVNRGVEEPLDEYAKRVATDLSYKSTLAVPYPLINWKEVRRWL